MPDILECEKFGCQVLGNGIVPGICSEAETISGSRRCSCPLGWSGTADLKGGDPFGGCTRKYHLNLTTKKGMRKKMCRWHTFNDIFALKIEFTRGKEMGKDYSKIANTFCVKFKKNKPPTFCSYMW